MSEEARKQLWWLLIMCHLGVLLCLIVEINSTFKTTNTNLSNSGVVNETIVTKEYEKPLSEAEKMLEGYENPAFIKCSGYINVRSTPNLDTDNNIIGTAENLAICEVVNKHVKTDINRTWYRVKFGDIEGYVLEDYLELDRHNVENLVEHAKINKAIINKSVYEYKEKDAKEENIIAIIEEGSVLELSNCIDGWYATEYDDTITYIQDSKNVSMLENSKFKTIKLSKTTESFISEFTNFGVTTNNKIIYVRESLDENSKYIGALMKNTGVDVIEEVEYNGKKWSKIVSGKVSGYILSNNVVTGDDAKIYGEKHAKLMAFIGDEEQDVYTESTRVSRIWTQLAKHQAYEVVDRDKYWVEVALDTGDISYTGDYMDSSNKAFINIENENVTLKYSIGVAIPFIEIQANNEGPQVKEEITQSSMEFRRKIVEYACQFIGNPYVWGGVSLTDGADCSGFVQSVLKEFNVHIPRVSRDQAKVGIELTSDELKPGDLIFYANRYGTVDHVAMYIGNGMIINAGSAKSGILLNVWNYRTPVAMKDVIGARSR